MARVYRISAPQLARGALLDTIMSLPAVLWHYFRTPLPYVQTLALQEKIHALQLAARHASNAHADVLLLLQHRPVYTAGRRQTEDTTRSEQAWLNTLGADFVRATRGGELTYHGPGQLVGYPLVDLGRTKPPMGARDYVCRMQTMLKNHLHARHGVQAAPSDHTGVFLGDGKTKVASIGVQVRHRLTSHGFAINVTDEPLAWLNTIVACGLEDVVAGSISGAKGNAEGITVEDEATALAAEFGRIYGRHMVCMRPAEEGDVGAAILALEEEAAKMGEWHREPLHAPSMPSTLLSSSLLRFR